MAKYGIQKDYDLMANISPSANKGTKCAVCDTENISFQWSDYSGQAMCTVCGCPYQLQWGSEEQQEEGNYPYLSMVDEFIDPCRKYWSEKHQWVYYGIGIGDRPGLREFYEWYKEKGYDNNE
jgi:hypothetical protein